MKTFMKAPLIIWIDTRVSFNPPNTEESEYFTKLEGINSVRVALHISQK